jgi:hypothetical protein
VALNTIITLDSIIMTGIDAATTMSVIDGEYSIGDGAFTSTAGSVINGQAVLVRHLSSFSNSTTTTLLSVGALMIPLHPPLEQLVSVLIKHGALMTLSTSSAQQLIFFWFNSYQSTTVGKIVRLKSDVCCRCE